ncbi:hypothetical protein V5279_18890 [Bradyrhizobium sp. 26S5]|uniref:hypothetical protein n=1 Tax=Bradyrhizobium sp. 26S5 TaxID=3139729 RepID=UPI0030D1C225
MKELDKKHDDEMLVVHKPPTARNAGVPSAGPEALPQDVARLAARLAASSAGERARLIGLIQNQFGNAFVTRVLHAVRDGAAAPVAGRPAGGGGR